MCGPAQGHEEEVTELQQAPPKVPHFTPDERSARGQAARSDVPRTSHVALDAATERDPLALLRADDVNRVQELLPIRYARMLASPFAFYRGGAAIMAYDLAPTPRSGLHVQLCGDAHLANFGGYASAERSFVFDLNDFDETLPGPFEWDVKRLAASFEVAARHRGMAGPGRRQAVLTVVRAYREAMRDFAAMRNLDVWYARLDMETLREQIHAARASKQEAAFSRGVEKAKSKDSMRALAKLTRLVDGEPRIVSDPPLIVPIAELVGEDADAATIEAQVGELIRLYRRTLQHDRRALLESFRYVDLARKVVGVGSVGTRCWIALLLGRDSADPLFLQIKEAGPSVLEQYLGRSTYGQHGQRVVEGQRMMQAASDIFLGWIRNKEGLDGRPHDYYVRQLWDWKAAVDLEVIEPRGLEIYASVCGWTLARAHARSGDRIAISGYLGKSDAFDRAVAEFAAAYADQNERDYEALVDAVKAGTIVASEAA
jgi:uncharacterized protein (DUF2252 family)